MLGLFALDRVVRTIKARPNKGTRRLLMGSSFFSFDGDAVGRGWAWTPVFTR